LDGTLAQYDHWRGEKHIGEPLQYVHEALDELREWGWRIVVFTTRGNTLIVKSWLRYHDIPFDAVNDCSHNPPGCSQKPIADVYFEDREASNVGKPYNWPKAMRRVRKLYQPNLDTNIDDASCWGPWYYRWLPRRGKKAA